MIKGFVATISLLGLIQLGLSQVNFTAVPTSVPAGLKANLKLDSPSGTPSQFSCASEFPLKETIVEKNNIILRYIHVIRPDVMCIMEVDMYGKYAPVFDLPALEAGEYTILRNETYECLQQEPACKIAEILDSVGVLNVVAENQFSENFWYLDKKVVLKEKASEISVLNPSKGSCNDYFTNQSVQVNGNTITLSFASRRNDDIVCITDQHPSGPTFELPALTAGSYKVMVADMPPCSVCEEGVEICAICDIAIIPMYIGNLRAVEENSLDIKIKTNKLPAKLGEIKQSKGIITLKNLPEAIQVDLTNPAGKKVVSQNKTIQGGVEISYNPQNISGPHYLIIRDSLSSQILGKHLLNL